MNKRWLRLTAIVAEREIRQRGRSRAFMVSTIVLLLVVAAGVTIPAILAHSAKPQRVGIVGGQLAPAPGSGCARCCPAAKPPKEYGGESA